LTLSIFSLQPLRLRGIVVAGGLAGLPQCCERNPGYCFYRIPFRLHRDFYQDKISDKFNNGPIWPIIGPLMAHKLIILVVLIHHCCERNKGNIFFLNSFQTWRVHLVGQDLEHWPIIGLLMAFRTLHLCFYVSFNFLPYFKFYQWTLTVIYWIFMGITINTLQNRTKAIMANYWPCNGS